MKSSNYYNIVIAEESREGNAKKVYSNKGVTRMVTNTTGIPISFTCTNQKFDSDW